MGTLQERSSAWARLGIQLPNLARGVRLTGAGTAAQRQRKREYGKCTSDRPAAAPAAATATAATGAMAGRRTLVCGERQRRLRDVGRPATRSRGHRVGIHAWQCCGVYSTGRDMGSMRTDTCRVCTDTVEVLGLRAVLHCRAACWTVQSPQKSYLANARAGLHDAGPLSSREQRRHKERGAMAGFRRRRPKRQLVSAAKPSARCPGSRRGSSRRETATVAAAMLWGTPSIGVQTARLVACFGSAPRPGGNGINGARMVQSVLVVGGQYA